MRHIGNISLIGGGIVQNLRVENLPEDPAAPLVGQIWYNTDLGQYRTFDGTTVSSIALTADVEALETLVGKIRDGAGLNAQGEYAPTAGAEYIGTATSLNDADQKLAAALKALSDSVTEGGDATAVQAELDATQIGAGLGTNGAYVADGDSNYISDATSLNDADQKLDAAVKGVSNAAGAAASAASAAATLAGDAMTAAGNAHDAADAARAIADNALSVDGGSMAGNIAMGGVHKITGLADGTTATDAVNKGQLDAAIAGLDFQADVLDVQIDATLIPAMTLGARYVITDPATIADEFGDIEGLGAGDIVEYDGSAFQVVYDVSEAGPGAMVWNRAAATFWYYNTSWAAFGGISGIEAGVGLVKNGNVLSVELGAGIGQLPSNEVGVDVLAAGGLFLTEDGSNASATSNAQLSIKRDGSTLTVSANGLKVNAQGIGANEIAEAALGNGLDGGGGVALSVVRKLGGGIIVDADGLSIDPTVLEFLPLAGGELEGPLTLSGAPTEDLHAASKAYVDALGETVSDNLSTVQDNVNALETRINGSHFVYDGTGASSLTHTVTHNIGVRFVNVTVTDALGEVVIPDTITMVDENSLTVTFAAAVTCYVVVTAIKPAAQQ